MATSHFSTFNLDFDFLVINAPMHRLTRPSKFKAVLLLFVSALLTCLLSPALQASNQLIHVGLIDNKPWAYQTEEGRLVGIYPELLKQVTRTTSTDIQFRTKLLPLKRILLEIDNQHSPTALTFMSFKPAREKRMRKILPIYKTPFVVVSHIDNPINTLEDIRNKDIAMLLGGSGCPCLGKEIPYQKVRLNHHVNGLSMLDKGRVDGVAGPSMRLIGVAEELGIHNILSDPLIYEWRTVWLWASKLNKIPLEQLNEIQKKLEHLIEHGELDRLKLEHIPQSQQGFLYQAGNP